MSGLRWVTEHAFFNRDWRYVGWLPNHTRPVALVIRCPALENMPILRDNLGRRRYLYLAAIRDGVIGVYRSLSRAQAVCEEAVRRRLRTPRSNPKTERKHTHGLANRQKPCLGPVGPKTVS